MGRIIIRSYLDIVEIHPDLSDEEFDELIREEEEKSKELTEWPKL